MTFLVIDGEPIELSVRIGDDDFDLATFATLHDAAVAGGKWVRDRGLRFAPDSYGRLERAKRSESPVLTLDVWKAADVEAWMVKRSQLWHQDDYYPYIHVAHRMGL